MASNFGMMLHDPMSTLGQAQDAQAHLSTNSQTRLPRPASSPNHPSPRHTPLTQTSPDDEQPHHHLRGDPSTFSYVQRRATTSGSVRTPALAVVSARSHPAPRRHRDCDILHAFASPFVTPAVPPRYVLASPRRCRARRAGSRVRAGRLQLLVS